MEPSGNPNLPEVKPAIKRLDARMYWACFEDLFEHGNGVTRRVVPAQKDPSNPVLVPEKPWEGNYVGYPSVWKDPETGRWRMWYATRAGVAYAESDDGAQWQRPDLGLVEYEGSKANNLVFAPGKGHHSPCVYLDPAAEDPAERYKMCVSRGEATRTGGAMGFLASPDGLTWTMIKDPMVSILNDSQSTLLRDPDSGKLLCFHRPNFIVRTITMSWSEDEGRTWNGHNQWLIPDDYDRQLGIEHYALAVFPYDGFLLGLLKVYVNRWYDRRCWIELVISRPWPTYQPGEVWWRLSDRTPLVMPAGEDSWEGFMMSPGHGLVPVDDGHWLFYDSWNALHTRTATRQPHARSGIGRAFVRHRRFFEWYCDETPSFLRTAPLLVDGDALYLDCHCGEGEARASIELADGSTPDGFAQEDSSPLTGDAHDGRITFRGGSLRQFAGRPLHITFHLSRRARFYAFGVM